MSAALAIDHLMFTYPGAPSPAVRIAHLELAPGEQMLLTAASGAGKSTLLHLIAGLLEPQAGRIEIAGEDMFARRAAARDLLRGRLVGMIFQTFNLLSGFSALENVMAALMFSPIPRREHRARARALLERLGIDRTEATPETLSVGQQQRVAVARALACTPKLVLADEPTASLDPERAAEAMNLIQTACQECGAALLCVSHDPAMAPRFERRTALADLAEGARLAGAPGRA